jgi:hypothetical protein
LQVHFTGRGANTGFYDGAALERVSLCIVQFELAGPTVLHNRERVAPGPA